MDFELIKKEKMSLTGTSVNLTGSQLKNFEIIRKHWMSFNASLKLNRHRSSSTWTKYGLTLRKGDGYCYMTAIPGNEPYPGFECMEIPEGQFARFQHVGSMDRIKNTVHDIYKRTIPEKPLLVFTDRTIMHYELYDHRFQWNKKDSIIDIYLPLIES